MANSDTLTTARKASPRPTTPPLAKRIETLRAAIYKADEKLQRARTSAEVGSPAATLLDLIGNKLAHDAWRSLLRNEDEAHLPLTKSDVAASYEGFFPLLAALEGVMALSVNSIIHPTVTEVFKLLDWAQSECDSAALGALVPGEGQAAEVTRDTELTHGGKAAVDLALDCTYDIESLAEHLIRLADDLRVASDIQEAPSPALFRTLGTRTRELNSVLMSYLGGDSLTVRQAHRVMYGGAYKLTEGALA